MKKCQSRLKKTMVFIRKSMCAVMGGIWLLGGVSTGADVEGGACDSNHECVSNEKIANAVITIRTLQAGAESGCPRCKAALASLADTLVQADAPVSDVAALLPHGNAALTDEEIVSRADKGCEECKHRLPSVKDHRCPSNDEVKCMVRGSATEGELKRGADAGCARCKANLNWFNKYDR